MGDNLNREPVDLPDFLARLFSDHGEPGPQEQYYSLAHIQTIAGELKKVRNQAKIIRNLREEASSKMVEALQRFLEYIKDGKAATEAALVAERMVREAQEQKQRAILMAEDALQEVISAEAEVAAIEWETRESEVSKTDEEFKSFSNQTKASAEAAHILIHQDKFEQNLIKSTGGYSNLGKILDSVVKRVQSSSDEEFRNNWSNKSLDIDKILNAVKKRRMLTVMKLFESEWRNTAMRLQMVKAELKIRAQEKNLVPKIHRVSLLQMLKIVAIIKKNVLCTKVSEIIFRMFFSIVVFNVFELVSLVNKFRSANDRLETILKLACSLSNDPVDENKETQIKYELLILLVQIRDNFSEQLQTSEKSLVNGSAPGAEKKMNPETKVDVMIRMGIWVMNCEKPIVLALLEDAISDADNYKTSLVSLEQWILIAEKLV